ANAGLTLEHTLELLPVLEQNGVELVEQPLAKEEIAGLGQVQAATHLPVVADESLQTADDLERLAAAGVRGVNLKLMKLGGLAAALRIARRARELGLGIMLGSMIETSIGATAMAHLSGLADWLDLDSPVLISNDPFVGIAYSNDGRVTVPNLPGIGVTARND
ncbi:MAG TPA: enolase C-terminal domain-like protein, partial [Anaerolineaceae bacterium]